MSEVLATYADAGAVLLVDRQAPTLVIRDAAMLQLRAKHGRFHLAMNLNFMPNSRRQFSDLPGRMSTPCLVSQVSLRRACILVIRSNLGRQH